MNRKNNRRWLALAIAIVITGAVIGLLDTTFSVRAQSIAIAPKTVTTVDCSIVSCTTFLPLIAVHRPSFLYLPLIAVHRPVPFDVEVTQSVQQPDNSVPLIQNRTTYVRWTLTSTVAYTNVSAYLYGINPADSAPLPGSPIAALNNTRTLAASADRLVYSDTFNFNLPAAWLNQSSIRLTALATNDDGYQLTTLPKTFGFKYAKPLNATLIPIAYHCTSGGTATVSPQKPFDYLPGFTYETFPVPTFTMALHASIPYDGPCASDVPAPTNDDWITGPPYTGGMLYDITVLWRSEGSPDNYYYGLVHVDCPGGACAAGLGWINAYYTSTYKASVGFDGTNSAHFLAPETLAHELGHNHGLHHAPGCGTVPDKDHQWYGYPYADGYIGDSTHLNYGFNIKTPAIYPSTVYSDFMNFCTIQWVSDYTYNRLWAFDNPTSALLSNVTLGDRSDARHATQRGSILISGSIDPSGHAEFQPAYSIDLPAQRSAPGAYAIDLLDSQGQMLASYPFEPASATIDRYPASGVEQEALGFVLLVPDQDNVASLRVRHAQTIVGELRPGTHAPQLSKSVAAFNAATQDTRISWSASDPDREPLHYLVRASIDNGASWQTIGVNLDQPQIDLDPAYFNGQSVLIQVLASDGVHTRQLNLGPYAIR
jgi:hypothetical protein